jgi:dTDP-4-dehydrorhamnose reductase
VRRLEGLGASVTTWDRRENSPLSPVDGTNYVRELQPQIIFHLAVASEATNAVDEARKINRDWPVWLAAVAEEIGAKLVFTSTAMVFSSDADGPFRLDSPPNSPDGYGYEKRCAEREIAQKSPNAVTVRLGWQIDDALGSNNMLDNLARQVKDTGKIRASTRWLPACSWLTDTVDVLASLANQPGGLYMVDANEGWTFHAIATALADRRGEGWTVEPTDSFVHDQRLLDPRITIPSLREHLSALRDIPPAPVG